MLLLMNLRLFLPILLLTMCASLPASAADDLSAGLVNKAWKLVKWQQKDQPMTIEKGGRGIVLQMTVDGKISGFASVNRFAGSYSLEGKDGITWGEGMAVTKMAGPEPLMKQERAFLTDFPQMTKYSLEGGNLRLSDAGGDTTMTFEAMKGPGL